MDPLAVESPPSPLTTQPATLPALPETIERHRLLREWNDTAASFPEASCIHEFFEEWARRRPGEVAVVQVAEVGEAGEASGETSRAFTYRELDEESNRLARHLRERAAARGEISPASAEAESSGPPAPADRPPGPVTR